MIFGPFCRYPSKTGLIWEDKAMDGLGRYVFDIAEGIKWADFGSFFLEKLKSAA